MISETERKRVVEAIRAAESKTAGEIFCVIMRASSGYRLVPVAWAALIALLVPLPLIYFTSWPAGLIYMTQLIVFLAAMAILSLPAVRYRVVPRQAMHSRAHAEARRQFLAHGLASHEGAHGRPDLCIRRGALRRDRCGCGHQREGHAEGVGGCGGRDGHRDRGWPAGRWIYCCGGPMRCRARAALSAGDDQSGRIAEQAGGDLEVSHKVRTLFRLTVTARKTRYKRGPCLKI